MGRKKTVVKDLNEEKENNNQRLEYTNSATDVVTSIVARIFNEL